jgi:hypothetical protein
MVDNIATLQDFHKYALSQIPKMTMRDKEYYLRPYNYSIKRDQALEYIASKLCSVGNEVGKYINTLIEELQIQPLEVRGQVLTRNQLQVKLEDNHMKQMIKINQLEEMENDAIGVLMINLTKIYARIQE